MKRLVPLAFIVLLMAAACEQQVQEPVDVSTELDSLQKKIVWLKYRLGELEWQSLTDQDPDSLDFYRRAWRDVCGDAAALERLQRNTGKLVDEAERRRHQLITSLLLQGAVESSQTVAELRDSLSRLAEGYTADLRGRPHTAEELRTITRTSRDRVFRERAWQAWTGLGGELSDGVERLIRLRNQRAVRLRYNNFAALALDADSLEASWITALLDSLEKITEEPYQRALQRRGAETGRNQLQPWDLMWAGGNGLSQINRHFPVDSQISFLQAAMMSCGIDLQTLPIYWDVTALDDIPPLVRACIVRPGYDLRVRANLRPGFPTQSELARETGIAIQAAFVSQEEPLFACLIDDTWRRMAGLVFEEIVNRPEFLVNAAGVPPTAVEAYRQARYDQTVINWRYLLAGARFEYEAYLNPNRDLDKLWWDISERLLDLPRHDQLSPWASRVSLIEQPLASINRILGGLAAVQTLNFLQDHNQALLDVRTRSFLVQHYFRYGASADWRRLLSHATEQPLSHRALSDWLDAEAVQP